MQTHRNEYDSLLEDMIAVYFVEGSKDNMLRMITELSAELKPK
jgi:hypothetical protein